MKMKTKVLAVLVLALLMINMAPVMRAEAAEEILTVNWKGNEVYVPVGNYPYYVVFKDFSSSGDLVILSFDKMKSHKEGTYYSLGFYDDSGGLIETGTQALSYGHQGVSKTDYLETAYYYWGFTLSKTKHDASKVISNYDICDVLTGEVVYEAYSEPIVLPVTEPGYDYWLYHKTTFGEYMYWSKDPFDLEVSDGKYLLNLSTGDIVYRLHMNPSHIYYRQILSGSMQYVVSSGDIFRSSHELVFDGITIDAWTEGDVTSEVVEEQYSIPHITEFLDRVRGVRSPAGGPREYFMAINLALSGEFDAAVTDQKVLIDGNYILPSEEYLRLCDSENIEPSMTHFMEFVKNKEDEYYVFVDWSHIESIVNLAGLTSDYGFRLNYSGAVDALIERGEFGVLYSESVQVAYDDDIRRLCCPYRLACTLIGVIEEEYYYGDTYITVLYSELDKTIEDVSGVYSDYVSLDNDLKTDAIESTINGAQSDQLQDYIDKKDAELDALIEEYEMKLATLDETLTRVEAGEGDLFGTFSRIANGISGMSGSLRDISTAVGNVFAFFPDEITSLLYAGFIALIVIAVYKALRG